MSAADDLIEQMESETGQRIDDNGNNSLAMNGLIGALSCDLGNSPAPYRAKDDVAAGLLMRYQMSPEYAREQENKKAIVAMLSKCMSPPDIIRRVRQ